MLLQHKHVYAPTGEQKPQHRPGRTAAGDAAGQFSTELQGRQGKRIWASEALRPTSRPGRPESPLPTAWQNVTADYTVKIIAPGAGEELVAWGRGVAKPGHTYHRGCGVARRRSWAKALQPDQPGHLPPAPLDATTVEGGGFTFFCALLTFFCVSSPPRTES